MFPHHRHVMLNNQVISSFLGKVDCIHNNRILAILITKLSGEWSCHPPPNHATKYSYQLFWTKVISKKILFRMARKDWTKTGQVWFLFSTRLSNNSSQNMSLMFNPLDLYVSSASLPIWLSSLLVLAHIGAGYVQKSLQNLTTNKKILKRWFKGKVNSFQLTCFFHKQKNDSNIQQLSQRKKGRQRRKTRSVSGMNGIKFQSWWDVDFGYKHWWKGHRPWKDHF